MPNITSELLDEIEEYLDARADADTDAGGHFLPNKAMKLLTALQRARDGVTRD